MCSILPVSLINIFLLLWGFAIITILCFWYVYFCLLNWSAYGDNIFFFCAQATFEAFIGIRDDEATQRLKLFSHNLQVRARLWFFKRWFFFFWIYEWCILSFCIVWNILNYMNTEDCIILYFNILYCIFCLMFCLVFSFIIIFGFFFY